MKPNLSEKKDVTAGSAQAISRLSRRQLLASPAVLAAGSFVPGGLLAAVLAETPPLPDLSDWDGVRAQFALDPQYAHFASFFIVSHPAPVRAALEAYRRAIDHNPFLMVERSLFEGESGNLGLRVCREVADYLGGHASEVCLTGNTTTSLALVYQGLPLRAGDEVLTTTHDHFSHHESIRLAAERAGATLRKIALFEDAATATADSMIDRLLSGIGPATRVVGLTWVHSATGMRLPIRDMAAALRARSGPPLILVVDGVHGFGSSADPVASLGCDYFCAGTHKWIFAPRGTGILWANADNWARLRPLIPSFSDGEQYEAWLQDRPPATPTNANRASPGGFHAYEHQWGMAAAFRMHRQMGVDRVAARIAALNTRCKEGLAENPRIRLHTPMAAERSAGLVAFEVEGQGPAETVRRLLAKGVIASASPYAVSYARLAPSLVNTPAEVDRAVEAVHAISS